MLEIGIESSTLDLIRQGRKTIEGRLGKPKFLKIKPGDAIKIREDIWENGQIVESRDTETVLIVKQVLYFETFREMLESLDFTTLLPLAHDIEEALGIYRSFYSREEEEELGVVAISFGLA